MRCVRVLSLVLALVICGGCGGQGGEGDREPLKVGWFLWPGWYPMALAQELGLFEKHGARIEPILYDSYTRLMPDLAAGRLEGCFSGLYEILKAGVPGVKVVLLTDYSVGGEGLVVTEDIVKPTDLEGKRIGVQGALSGSEFITTTYLRKHGLARSAISFVDVPPESVLEEMPLNIQGGYTWEPFLSQAKGKGFRILFTTAETLGMVPDVVAFHGAVVRDRAQDVRGFVAAWFEAQEFWKAHPEEAAKLIAKVTGLKPAEVSLEGCMLVDLEGNRKAFSPGDGFSSLFYTGAKQIEFFVGMGDASVKPDLDAILESGYLPGE